MPNSNARLSQDSVGSYKLVGTASVARAQKLLIAQHSDQSLESIARYRQLDIHGSSVDSCHMLHRL